MTSAGGDTIAQANVTIKRAEEALARSNSRIESVQPLAESLQTQEVHMTVHSRAVAGLHSPCDWTSQEPESDGALWREWTIFFTLVGFHNVQEAAYRNMSARLKVGGEENTLTHSGSKPDSASASEPDISRSRLQIQHGLTRGWRC